METTVSIVGRDPGKRLEVAPEISARIRGLIGKARLGRAAALSEIGSTESRPTTQSPYPRGNLWCHFQALSRIASND